MPRFQLPAGAPGRAQAAFCLLWREGKPPCPLARPPRRQRGARPARGGGALGEVGGGGRDGVCERGPRPSAPPPFRRFKGERASLPPRHRLPAPASRELTPPHARLAGLAGRLGRVPSAISVTARLYQSAAGTHRWERAPRGPRVGTAPAARGRGAARRPRRRERGGGAEEPGRGGGEVCGARLFRPGHGASPPPRHGSPCPCSSPLSERKWPPPPSQRPQPPPTSSAAARAPSWRGRSRERPAAGHGQPQPRQRGARGRVERAGERAQETPPAPPRRRPPPRRSRARLPR